MNRVPINLPLLDPLILSSVRVFVCFVWVTVVYTLTDRMRVDILKPHVFQQSTFLDGSWTFDLQRDIYQLSAVFHSKLNWSKSINEAEVLGFQRGLYKQTSGWAWFELWAVFFLRDLVCHSSAGFGCDRRAYTLCICVTILTHCPAKCTVHGAGAVKADWMEQWVQHGKCFHIEQPLMSVDLTSKLLSELPDAK